MSKQRVSTSLKYALWEAHDFKCFYHGEPLRWDELSVDHIIPEYLTTQPEALAQILRQVGLPPGWSLTATANLVPACRACNERMRAILPHRNQLILWLQEAAEKAPEVEVLQRRFKEQRRMDRAKAQLEFAMATGLLSEADLGRMMAAAAAGEDLVSLTAGIELFNGVSMDQLRPSNVEALLDMPVQLGTEMPEALRLSHEDGSTVQVRTVREYRQAVESGYDQFRDQDGRVLRHHRGRVDRPRRVAAVPPELHSRAAGGLVRYRPAAVVAADPLRRGVRGRYGAAGGASDDRRVGGCGCRAGGVGRVIGGEVEFAGMRTSLREILRADLDGDGCEDVLVSRYLSAIGGSLGLGLEPVALARRSFEAPFVETEMLDSSDPE